jgi:exo-beta-1,3-glucanase (GH17 family)
MDDYNFWNKSYAKPVAEAVDFIGLHAYAFWNNLPLANSISWTQGIYDSIQTIYPSKQLVIGETGWPTSRIYNDGSYEGGLIGIANETNQQSFFEIYNNWINQKNIVSFYFVAFDEKWKGGNDGVNPEMKAEKNWGLYFSDRTPKKAVQ